MNEPITRAARKVINRNLHRAGLPTLQGARTVAEYRRSYLTRAQRAQFDALSGKPASTGHVAAKIAAHTAAKNARTTTKWGMTFTHDEATCAQSGEWGCTCEDAAVAQSRALFAQVG